MPNQSVEAATPHWWRYIIYRQTLYGISRTMTLEFGARMIDFRHLSSRNCHTDADSLTYIFTRIERRQGTLISTSVVLRLDESGIIHVHPWFDHGIVSSVNNGSH
jgi:hypothetical protein